MACQGTHVDIVEDTQHGYERAGLGAPGHLVFLLLTQGLKQRGLARPGWAEQGDYFTGADTQAQ